MDDALKKGALKNLNAETRLLFSPALIKFLATRLGALQKGLVVCCWFDHLIYVVIISSSTFYSSELTKL